MYFDLPVISTNIPGIMDHFFKLATLVEPGDSDALSIAIDEVIDKYGEKKEIANKAKHQVINQYSWDRVSKSYNDYFIKIING